MERPGTATSLPSLEAPPSRGHEDKSLIMRELHQLRMMTKEQQTRNQSMTVEFRAMEQHYRKKLQSYADSCRMNGQTTPSESVVAYWEEAQRLFENAIEQLFGADGLPYQKSLSAPQLKQARTQYEQRIVHANTALEHTKAELRGVHAELREARSLKQEWTKQTAAWTDQAAARDAALGEATSEVQRLRSELAADQAAHASALKTATDELQHANAVHETAIKHANTEFARVNSERLRLRMELSAVPEERATPPPLPPPKPPVPAEVMIPRREHEAKLAEAAAKASAKLREVQTAHGDELRDVRKKVWRAEAHIGHPLCYI